MGAQMVKEVASKTSDVAGDGTTTATVLAQSMLSEGLKAVAAGMNPMDLKRGLDKAVLGAVDALEEMSTACTDSEAIAQVGSISANADTSIGDSSQSAPVLSHSSTWISGPTETTSALVPSLCKRRRTELQEPSSSSLHTQVPAGVVLGTTAHQVPPYRHTLD